MFFFEPPPGQVEEYLASFTQSKETTPFAKRDAHVPKNEAAVTKREEADPEPIDADLEREADSIVRQAQDEAALETPSPPRSPSQEMDAPLSRSNVAPSRTTALELLSSLSTPRDLRSPPDIEEETEAPLDPIYARLAGLKPGASLPGSSTQFPLTPSETPGRVDAKKGKPFDVPGMRTARDDDMDSWCCKSTVLGVLVTTFDISWGDRYLQRGRHAHLPDMRW